jgi:hypothetical protein
VVCVTCLTSYGVPGVKKNVTERGFTASFISVWPAFICSSFLFVGFVQVYNIYEVI